MSLNLKDVAIRYLDAGLSVVPTNLKEKKPFHNGRLIKWKQYQTELPARDQVQFWFGRVGETPPAEALAIVCGSVSGGLEMVDFDAKAALYEPWAKLVEERCPGLLGRLLTERTQSGGLHAVYRCPQAVIPGNQKLAMHRHAVSEDDIVLVDGRPNADVNGKRYAVKKDSMGHYVPICMIETRGQGGYFLCSPSKGYELLRGSYEQVPEVIADEREVLLACARSLNEFVEENKIQTGMPKQRKEGGGLRPGDDYNQRGDVGEVLLKHGWTPYVGHTWTRPGKGTGASASLLDGKVLYVFSTSVSEFRTETGYSPFAVYAILEHGGDFKAAGRALYEQGYGDRAPAGGFAQNDGENDGFQLDQGSGNGAPDWRPPMPLEQHANVPAFPVAIFPRPLADYCHAVADAAECPPDLVGQTVLGAVSATVLSKCRVDWGKEEPLTFFAMAAVNPSEHKSTVDGEILKSFREAEITARKAAAKDIDQALQKREMLKQKLEEARRQYGKGKASEYDVLSLAEELRTFEIPRDPRKTIDDITPETLATRLHQHGALAILSSEAGVIDVMTNRYSNAGNANYKLILKSWGGDPHQVDRQNRNEILERPLLTIAVMCQPGSFAEMVKNVEGARDLGLLSRFLYSVPASKVGNRTLDIVPVPHALHALWANTLGRLDLLGEGVIRFSTGALAIQTEFARGLERRIGPGGDLEHIGDWIGKMQRGQSSRLVALLHVLEQADPYGTAVSAGTMKRALALCEYYIAHAQRAFEMLKPKPEGIEMPVAKRMAAFVASQETVTNADLTRRFGLRKAELEPYVNLLGEYGYLAKDPQRKGAYLVNPLSPIQVPMEPAAAFEQVAEMPPSSNGAAKLDEEDPDPSLRPDATRTVQLPGANPASVDENEVLDLFPTTADRLTQGVWLEDHGAVEDDQDEEFLL